MQTLDWKDEQGREQKREYPIPPDAEGVKISVGRNGNAVILQVGETRYSLTPGGARDVALALRQAANKITRER